jgi:aminoglycoside 3-N-acetyltransferase
MLRGLVGRVLGGRHKRTLKASLAKIRLRWINTFLSYDVEKLRRELRAAGIRETDTLLVHVNYEAESGFRGTPRDLVEALVGLVGEKGNLLMVSIPFQGSAYDHLARGKVFDVRKTISMMGLVTETFRRRDGTRRSLHPTHPVLAVGKDADWIVADHDKSLFPCGPGTPFEKLRSSDGKILFFDVGFGAITFFHYTEDQLKDRMPFAIYDERRFQVRVKDWEGQERLVETLVFDRSLKRAAHKLEAEMNRQGKVRAGRVGNSRYLLVSAADAFACQSAMVDARNYPYDLS